ncbi:IS110 family transposase [Brevibacillus fluminis]|uniref:IS110 family transposase n=1 Tax=Brevibacillus fluminis TaxID=511487 RepID=UPI003F8CE69B
MGKSSHIQGRKGNKFSQHLRGVNLEQVLIVAIDAAKLHQKALICNYFGDIIVKPFFFSVNRDGIQSLCDRIKQAEKDCNAVRIFLGIEATGHYYEDIVRILGQHGYDVQIINPYTTKEERASALNWCKTDDLDLVAIAHAIVGNKATETKLPEGKYRELLTLTRARRSEVRKRSSLRMEIRGIMDVIWREFQGFSPDDHHKPIKTKIFSDMWGKSSLFFMKYSPHPSMVLALGEQGIRESSRKHNLKIRSSTIQKLLHAANQALSRPKEELAAELLLLSMKLEDLERYDQKICRLECEIESVLLQTDGKLLLSIPGIAVVTAAEAYAEMGDVSQYENPHQIIKKAGTNPVVIQSGGGKGYYGSISKQGNDHLRFVVYTAGKSLSLHNTDLRPFYERLKEKGKHARKIHIAMGNKFLKIAFAMLRDKKPFLSQNVQKQYADEMNKKLKYHSIANHLTAS